MAELDNVAVDVRRLEGQGHVVRLQVGGDLVYLDPDAAAELATTLQTTAMDAVHADRGDRRG